MLYLTGRTAVCGDV